MPRIRPPQRLSVVVTTALAVPLSVLAFGTSSSSAATSAVIPGQTSGLLPSSKVILKSTVQVNLEHHSARLCRCTEERSTAKRCGTC